MDGTCPHLNMWLYFDRGNKLRDKATPLSTDELALIDESTLRSMLSSTKKSIGRTRDRERRQNLELNACYIHREIETRELRRKAHAEWLKNRNNRGNRKEAV